MKKLGFIFFICLSEIMYAQPGSLYGYSFLNLPIPARTAALGGSSIALKDDDINTAAQNPALLSAGTSGALSMSYINFLSQVNYGYATYGQSFKNIGHFAAGLQAISYGNINQRDEYGNDLGSLKAHDYNFSLMYARDRDSLISYGVALKTIYSKYAQYTSVGNMLDAGITYRGPKRQLVLSAVMQNAGKIWKTYTGQQEKLPFNVMLGASYKLKHAPFRFIVTYDYLNRWDLTYKLPTDTQTVDPFTHQPIKEHKAKQWMDKLGRHMIIATEIVLTKNFFLRIGFNYKERKELSLPDKAGIAGFSGGFGIKISKFHFNYAYSQYSPGFGMHSITISTKFSYFGKSPAVPVSNATPL